MITLDFETYYDGDFSLSKISTEKYIRSPEFEVIGLGIKKDGAPTEWVSGSDELIADALHRYGCSESVCVAHNAAFDMAIMNWRYGVRPSMIIDTLSLSRPVVGLESGGSLRSLAEFYGVGHKGTEVYTTKGKHLKDFTPEELARFGEYCKLDVELTYSLLPHLLKATTRKELDLIDMVIRFFTEPQLELDKSLLETHLHNVIAKREALVNSVGVDKSFFTSNEKFAQLLREVGVEPPTKISPTTGKETYAFAKTDEEFKALLDHPGERVQTLVSARLGLKTSIEETRTQAFLEVAERGKLPIFLNYYGAVNTGRFSGGEKLNPQNLPRGGALRQSIIAPEGYSIVACDSSQVEARTLAWFAGQNDLVQDFVNNVDVYSSFASKVFGFEVNKHDHPKERFVGKTCFGAGTKVLTNKGWKPIETVSKWDKLWDGEEWVSHDGVVCNGTRAVITMYGLTATPTHEFFDGEEWVSWERLVIDPKRTAKAYEYACEHLPEPKTPKVFHDKRVRTGIERVYDIANAGKRHRYVVRGFYNREFIVHNCILGLGYGVGANKLRLTLKNGGVALPLEECERIVGIYRGTFKAIPALWKSCGKAIEAMFSGYGAQVGNGSFMLQAQGYRDSSKVSGVIPLPNGLMLRYPDMRAEMNEKGWLEYSYQKKRLRAKIYGGALTENIIQALARTVVSYQMLDIDKALKKISTEKNDGKIRRVVHMVHDEVIAIVPSEEAKATEDLMYEIMSTAPFWADGLPVSCEAGSGKTYADAK